MNKLALVSMAAIAASLPALASAQSQTVAPPVAWEEVPAASLNLPAAAPAAPGVSWQHRARPAAPVRIPDTAARVATHQNGGPVALVRESARGMRGGGMRHARPGGGMRHGRPGGGMHHVRPGKPGGMHHVRPGKPGGMHYARPGKPGGMHHVRPGKPGGMHYGRPGKPGGMHHVRPGKHGPFVKPMRPGGHHAGGGHGYGKRFHNFKRIHRGGRVHNFWWGPQFHIQNWGLYGFHQPLHDDWRWVRYYDDAYLIDREGRVHDERYDVEWDSYGERWDYDERGIPVYGEDRYDEDYGDDGGYDEDYAEGWDEEERGYADGPAYAPAPGYAPGGSCTVTYSYDSRHPVPPPPPPPCASGHGYGYVHGGTVVVTETTVTTAPVVTERVVYEDVVVHKKVRKHKAKRKYHKRHTSPPAPYYDGERG